MARALELGRKPLGIAIVFSLFKVSEKMRTRGLRILIGLLLLGSSVGEAGGFGGFEVEPGSLEVHLARLVAEQHQTTHHGDGNRVDSGNSGGGLDALQLG